MSGFQINRPVKILVIGDATVGKTAFVQRWVNRKFQYDYKMTVGVDFASKVVSWDNAQLAVQLWDVAGQERFTAMTRVYYREAVGAIIVFDLTKPSTFQNAVKWKRDVDEKCLLPDSQPIPCLLIGNKSDLPRELSAEEVQACSNELMFIGWAETSVLNGTMVDEAMDFLLDHVMQRMQRLDERLSHNPTNTTSNGDTVRLAAMTPAEEKKNCSC